jgi:PEGA domain
MRNAALRVSHLSAFVFLAGLLSVSPVARAGDVTISVLGLEPAAGAPDTIASAVSEALRQRATSTAGFRLVPGRDLVEVKLVFSCPDEAPACMSQAAQSIGATKILFGNVQPVGTDAYIVTLKLLDAERGVVESWISEQITKAQSAPAALRIPVQKWFATLTGQSVPGTIKVTGGVVGASVWLDGVQAGLLGADGLTIAGVAAGQRQITVSKAGYEKWEKLVTLGSGALEKVAVELKAIDQPGGRAEAPAQEDKPKGVDIAAAGAESEQPSAMESYNQGSRVAAWAVLGLGIVGVGLGGYSSYKVNTINSDLDQYRRYQCSTSSTGYCGADGKPAAILTPDKQNYVNDQKSAGDNWSKVQWIGYGVGGALLVTSTVLFYHGYFSKPSAAASNSRRSNLIVLPQVTPTGAGALALLSF